MSIPLEELPIYYYFTTTRNLAFCHGIMPGASAPGKFARSNARETPGKLQFQTTP
jgi:hypothetical protein